MNTKIQSEMSYDVPVRDLWEAITNADNFSKWYYKIAHFSLTPGDTYSFYDSESKTHFHECTVLECIPQEKLVHTWKLPLESKGTSTVHWVVSAIDDKHSKLTIIQEGIENLADGGPKFTAKNLQRGWDTLIQVSLRNYLYLIEKLHFSININAPKNRVWEELTNKVSYKTWTQTFCEGSILKGDMKLNGRIHFLNERGNGLYSDIVYFKVNERIMYKHLGLVENNQELPLDESSKRWTGCFESYKLMEINDNTTELEVSIDVVDASLECYRKKFPDGLVIFKELCEA